MSRNYFDDFGGRESHTDDHVEMTGLVNFRDPEPDYNGPDKPPDPNEGMKRSESQEIINLSLHQVRRSARIIINIC